MKTIRYSWRISVLVLVLLLLGITPSAAQMSASQPSIIGADPPPLFLPALKNTQSPVIAAKTEKNGWTAQDNVVRFLDVLYEGGFTSQEGTFEFIDLVQTTCMGQTPDTLANNPWPNAYVVSKFDPPEGAPVPFEWVWQLGAGEAIVLIGQTPPPAVYFSYQTFLLKPPGIAERLGIAIGDTVNIATIRTTGPTPFRRPLVYIITGNRTMEQYMRAAALSAGYPAAIINVEAIAPAIAPLGYGPEGSYLYMGHRVAGAENKSELETYIKDPPYRIFRVTPTFAVADDPQPVPVLRVRGTGHTEMELYPTLKRLRQAILEEQEALGMQPQELDTHVWSLPGKRVLLEKPYTGLQRGQFLMGATRDTNYLATYPNFRLREGENEYVIVYGVNHQKTGKVTYASASVYADKDRWFGVGTMLSLNYAGSANRYLPDDPNADMFYVLKVARACPDDEAYCLEVKKEFKGIDGATYACVLDDLDTEVVDPREVDLDEEEMFLIFRSYMEPATKVSPDDNELLYDQAIYFTE